MAYLITKTNGDTLVTVPDTEKNTDYGVTLVGRNYSGYGVFLNDNFIALMENFANGSAPTVPLTGQLWFSTTTKNLSVWEGSAWKVLSSITSSETEPGSAGRKVGDFWFDNSTFQLKIWTGSTAFERNITATSSANLLTITSTIGLVADDKVIHANIAPLDDVRITQILNSNQLRISANANVSLNDSISFTRGSSWYTIGPEYTRGQRTNGIIPATLTDTLGISHVVGLIYVNGSIVGAISNDVEYTPNTISSIAGFQTIKPGMQLRSSTSDQITKTVQAFSVGAAGFTLIPMISNADLLVGDRFSSSNVSIGSGATVTALFPNNNVLVSTTTTVYQNEDVIFQRGTENVFIYNGTSTNAQQLSNKSADLFAQLDLYTRFQQSVDIDGNLKVGGNISFLQSNGNLTVRNQVSAANITFTSNVPGIGSQTPVMQIRGLDGRITVRDDPTVPMGVATKQYVDATRDIINGFIASNIATITGAYATKAELAANVAQLTANFEAADADILNLVADKADITSPTLAGIPRAPTAVPSTATTQIATTAFVSEANVGLAARVNTLLSFKADIDSPSFTGIPRSITANSNTNTTQIATTAFVQAQKISPNFSGEPTASTAAPGDNSGRLATTAYVDTAVSAGAPDLSAYAPKASPAFTGTPTIAGFSTDYTLSDTKIPTTAWVQGAINEADTGNWLPSNKTISTNDPTGGEDGDFWFKV
jgi:hypothetical protein